MTTALAPVWLNRAGDPLDIAFPPFVAAPATLELARVDTAWPLYPSAEWFTKPAWLAPGQKMTVVTAGLEAGRVAGYVAPWGQCLLGGDPSQCFTAPTSPSAYAAAMQGDTHTAEGIVIKTANIGGGINHAPLHPGEFSQRVVDHYANTASQLMRVVYGEDEFGIWAAGALWPEVDERNVATIRASALSGDWRWRAEFAAYDMAGSQLVSVAGYPLIRGIAAALGDPHPIIMGGMGGVPSEWLEEVLMEAETITRGAAVAGVTGTHVHDGSLAPCSCQTPSRVAATTDVTPASPETPAQEQAPATADETRRAEDDQRLADLEASVVELSDGLRELQSWVAEQAASSLDESAAALPDAMPVAAAFGDNKAPPFTKADAPGPGGAPKAHEFVDKNSDGKCDECGKAKDDHTAS